KLGWRRVFIALGLLSLPWLPAWIKWMPRTGNAVGRADQRGPGFQDILSQRSFWGTCVGHFAANYLFYFMITWLPSYLVRERHLPMVAMTRIAGLYYAVDAVSAVLSGWLQDSFIAKQYPPTLVRKAAMGIGFSLAALAVVACVTTDTSYLPWLLAAGAGCGFTGPGLYTFPQTLAGAGAVGKWYGWQNGFANLAGVLGPSLTGLVLERTHNFLAPFAITAAISVMGGLSWVLMVGRVEQVKWPRSREFGAQPAGA
ncbi:MAG: MFS transporter, partial [Acidobacteria bacterium]|nr:MFS transporter [Acidobacteriota bacterium]